MYSKTKIEKLLQRYEVKFKKALGIKSKVKFHIYKRDSKKYKVLAVSQGHEKGLSLITNDTDADIFIFYDKHNTERDVIGTIFHELLHVRVSKLTGLITLKMTKGSLREERLVLDLERMFIKLFWSNKL